MYIRSILAFHVFRGAHIIQGNVEIIVAAPLIRRHVFGLPRAIAVALATLLLESSMVRLPSKEARNPRCFDFGTPYTKMKKDLVMEDEAFYRGNRVLGLLERNEAIKPAPQQWQRLSDAAVASFDVVVCFEDRVFKKVLEGICRRCCGRLLLPFFPLGAPEALDAPSLPHPGETILGRKASVSRVVSYTGCRSRVCGIRPSTTLRRKLRRPISSGLFSTLKYEELNFLMVYYLS